jgi:hypothetical protein
LIEAQDFIGAAGRLEQDLSASGLTQEIEKTFGDEQIQNKDVGDPLALLPQFLEGPVVTTNFDRILESVFSAAGKPFKWIYVGAAMKGATSALLENEHVLIKLHGTWTDQVNRVLTPDEYKRHYGGTQLEELVITRSLPFLVLGLFMMRRVLFMGCSLASDLTMAVGDLIKEKTEVSKHFCFSALSDSTPKAGETQEQAEKRVQDEHAKNQERLERSGIKPIWFPAHRYEFISDLLRAIQPPLGLSQKAQSFFSWFGTLTLLLSLTFIVPYQIVMTHSFGPLLLMMGCVVLPLCSGVLLAMAFRYARKAFNSTISERLIPVFAFNLTGRWCAMRWIGWFLFLFLPIYVATHFWLESRKLVLHQDTVEEYEVKEADLEFPSYYFQGDWRLIFSVAPHYWWKNDKGSCCWACPIIQPWVNTTLVGMVLLAGLLFTVCCLTGLWLSPLRKRLVLRPDSMLDQIASA